MQEVLSWLKLPELKVISDEFKLEGKGREREGYVQRIAEHVRANSGAEVAAEDEDEEAEGDDEVEEDEEVTVEPVRSRGEKKQDASTKFEVFIVHGHDNAMRLEITRIITNLGLKPVVLQEAPDSGLTILEKLERDTNRSAYAVVLLSPDDEGYSVAKGPSSAKKRARQNVILELGLVIGKLGRSKVAVLHQGDVELPSDIGGLVYIEYNSRHTDDASTKLARRLRQAGFPVDMNRIAE